APTTLCVLEKRASNFSQVNLDAWGQKQGHQRRTDSRLVRYQLRLARQNNSAGRVEQLHVQEIEARRVPTSEGVQRENHGNSARKCATESQMPSTSRKC
ncbi:MAG: hypothetical protein VXY07_09680, partial [Planctomycetota bacterium]|nr:hypothetical protein [Planctomycetota bacterium]